MKPSSLRQKDKQTLTLEQVNEQMKAALTKKGIYTKTLAHIEKIKGDIQGPLWAHVKEKLMGMISGVDVLEDKSDEFKPEDHPIPDRILWKASGVRKCARTLLAVENLVNNEEGYRSGLIKIDKEIKDLAERKQQFAAGK